MVGFMAIRVRGTSSHHSSNRATRPIWVICCGRVRTSKLIAEGLDLVRSLVAGLVNTRQNTSIHMYSPRNSFQ
jgi:hypothetical protein